MTAAAGTANAAPSASPAPRSLVIETAVGTGDPVNNGDGGPSRRAAVAYPSSVATAPDGTLYVLAGLTIRAVDPKSRVIRTVAGTGKPGFSGDGGPATKATFSSSSQDVLYGLSSIAVGPDGTLYVADAGNHRVRAVDPDDGTITTVAGRGKGKDDMPFTGDGGKATKATLHYPRDIAVGDDGTLYVNDALNYRIRAVDPKTKRITTVAGVRHPGDDGTGWFPRPDSDDTKASNTFVEPSAVAVGPDGLLYFAEDEEDRVRVVDVEKDTIKTVAGRGSASGYLENPTDIAFAGNVLYIAANDPFAVDQSKNRVFAFDLKRKRLTEFAGGADAGKLGDGDKPTNAYLGGPAPAGRMGITTGPAGAVYITDATNHRVRVVHEGQPNSARAAHPLSGKPIATLLGSGKKWTQRTRDEESDEEQGTFYRDVHEVDEVDLYSPESVVVDVDGTVYVADTGNDRIRVLAPGDDTVRTLAGTAESPDADEDNGDGGEAKDAILDRPRGLVLGPDRRLYFIDADSDDTAIRYVDLEEGTVDTVHGSRYELTAPKDLAIDGKGLLYVADSGNNRVCRMRATDDVCTTLVDDETVGSFSTVDPASVAVGRDGTVYLADSSQFKILAYDPRTKAVRTVAGTLSQGGVSGDGGVGTSAQLGPFGGLVLGPRDTLFFTDKANHRVRAVNLETGIVTAVAGNGSYAQRTSANPYEPFYGGGAFAGDGGPARKAKLDNPEDVTVGPDGVLYVADAGNNRIRMIGDADVSARGGSVLPVVAAVVLLLALAAAAFIHHRRRRKGAPTSP